MSRLCGGDTADSGKCTIVVNEEAAAAENRIENGMVKCSANHWTAVQDPAVLALTGSGAAVAGTTGVESGAVDAAESHPVEIGELLAGVEGLVGSKPADTPGAVAAKLQAESNAELQKLLDQVHEKDLERGNERAGFIATGLGLAGEKPVKYLGSAHGSHSVLASAHGSGDTVTVPHEIDLFEVDGVPFPLARATGIDQRPGGHMFIVRECTHDGGHAEPGYTPVSSQAWYGQNTLPTVEQRRAAFIESLDSALTEPSICLEHLAEVQLEQVKEYMAKVEAGLLGDEDDDSGF